jgi:chromosome segregation ATPase
MSINVKKISFGEENDYITLSNLICKGIFKPDEHLGVLFKDYELGDETLEKTTRILKKLEETFTINDEDYTYLIDILVTILLKLKSNIVELVERMSLAEQAIVYRDYAIKNNDEKFQKITWAFTNKIKKLKEDISDKDKENDRLSSSISKLSLNVIELEEKLEHSNNNFTSLKTENKKTKTKFEKEIESLKKINSSANEKISSLESFKSEYDNLDSKYKLLEQKYNSEILNYSKNLESKVKIENELEKIKKTLEEKNIIVSDYEKQIFNFKKLISDLNTSISQKDLEKKSDLTRISEFEKELSNYKIKNTDYENEIKILKAQITQIQEENNKQVELLVNKNSELESKNLKEKQYQDGLKEGVKFYKNNDYDKNNYGKKKFNKNYHEKPYDRPYDKRNYRNSQETYLARTSHMEKFNTFAHDKYQKHENNMTHPNVPLMCYVPVPMIPPFPMFPHFDPMAYPNGEQDYGQGYGQDYEQPYEQDYNSSYSEYTEDNNQSIDTQQNKEVINSQDLDIHIVNTKN